MNEKIRETIARVLDLAGECGATVTGISMGEIGDGVPFVTVETREDALAMAAALGITKPLGRDHVTSHGTKWSVLDLDKGCVSVTVPLTPNQLAILNGEVAS